MTRLGIENLPDTARLYCIEYYEYEKRGGELRFVEARAILLYAYTAADARVQFEVAYPLATIRHIDPSKDRPESDVL